MNSHLFQALPIGALFFRDPFNPNENPSIKLDDDHARKPSGEVITVNGGVLMFTHKPALVTYTQEIEVQEVYTLRLPPGDAYIDEYTAHLGAPV